MPYTIPQKVLHEPTRTHKKRDAKLSLSERNFKPQKNSPREIIPKPITISKTIGGGKTFPIIIAVPRPNITITNWTNMPAMAATTPPGIKGK